MATAERRDPSTPPMVPAGCLLLLVALAAATAGQGGYYRDVAVAVGVVLVAAVVPSVAAGRRHAGGQPTAIAMAVAAMALWAIAAGILAGHLDRALPTIALLGAVAAAVAVSRRASPPQREQLVTGIIVLGAAAAASGWIGVVRRAGPWAHPDGGLWRAATTVTYANAAAALLTMAALLACARIVSRTSVATRLGAFAILVGLGATLSRAGIASFALGFVVLAVLLGPRRIVAGTARILVGASIAVIGLLPSMPVGSTLRPGWAVVALVAGAAVACAPLVVPRWIGVALAALALASLSMLAFTHLELSSLQANRISLASPDRGRETHAALDLVRHHLVVGVGPGGAVFIWSTPDHRLVVDRYAHDEYLQLAAEQGLVGVALLAALAAAVVATARRGRRASLGDPVARALQAGAVAALVAFAAHSGFDFLWHVPAVALMAAVVIGLTSSIPVAPAVPLIPTLQKESV